MSRRGYPASPRTGETQPTAPWRAATQRATEAWWGQVQTMGQCGLLLLAAALCGCQFLRPPYHQPEAPVPASCPAGPGDGAAAAADGAATATVAWRDYVADERLRRLIEQAQAKGSVVGPVGELGGRLGLPAVVVGQCDGVHGHKGGPLCPECAIGLPLSYHLLAVGVERIVDNRLGGTDLVVVLEAQVPEPLNLPMNPSDPSHHSLLVGSVAWMPPEQAPISTTIVPNTPTTPCAASMPYGWFSLEYCHKALSSVLISSWVRSCSWRQNCT